MARPPESDAGLVAGRQPVLELLKAGKSVERLLIARGSHSSGPLGEIHRRARDASIPVRIVPRTEVEKAAAGLNHQGVVAFTSRFRYTPLNEIVARPDALVVFLDAVTDPHNLGSLLRSADGAGFHGVVVPSRRAVGVTATVRKVSAGATEVVPVARVPNLGRALDEAKQAGLWIAGLDERASEDIWTSDLLEPPLGLVLGAEGKGLSKTTAERCDALVSIPAGGRLASLNVAIAGAVVMFEVARRRRGQLPFS